MELLKSFIESSSPRVDGGSVRLAIAKDNTKAYDSTGKEFILTPCALSQDFKSWEGGVVTVNHKYKERGKLSDIEYKDGFVYATLGGLSSDVVELINTPAFRGVSQESTIQELSGNKVTRLSGTGTTLVFFPETPACSPSMGCGVPVSSTVDDNFNFPLNSDPDKSDLITPNGETIMADDISTKLESTISEQKTEITELKSTIETLRQELDSKDAKLESTVNAAVKAALEAHDTQLKEQSEMAATIEVLSTVMSEETRDEFLKSEPSIAVIKSTIAAIKSTTSKQVGASKGATIESTVEEENHRVGGWNAFKQTYE